MEPTGCYLLVIVAEPPSDHHKALILHKVAKGLLSWDVEATGCDLRAVEAACRSTAAGPPDSDILLQFSTETLAVEVLYNPQVSTAKQCLNNLLTAFTKHKHLIHAGYAFAGSGSWVLQNGVFTFNDFVEAFQEAEVQRVLRTYPSINIHVHCPSQGSWTNESVKKQAFSQYCNVVLNPTDCCDSVPGSQALLQFLDRTVVSMDVKESLQASTVVGNIRFNRPTLYIFPGGQGDCALFGINGFNMLIDGGFNRKPCFWEFIRHLDRLDAVMITRFSETNSCGITTMMQRKVDNHVHPQMGYIFCNIGENKACSDETSKDSEDLLISVLAEGHKLAQCLKLMNLPPHPCLRDAANTPFVLYQKVGHGTLDMYVLNPSKESKELKEFYQQWNSNRPDFGTVKSGMKVNNQELAIPLSHSLSISALLVWKPANPNEAITRILFTGSTPQNKITEALEKLKFLELLKYPTCTPSKLQSKASEKVKPRNEKLVSKTLINRQATRSPSGTSPSPKSTGASTPRKEVSVKSTLATKTSAEVAKAASRKLSQTTHPKKTEDKRTTAPKKEAREPKPVIVPKEKPEVKKPITDSRPASQRTMKSTLYNKKVIEKDNKEVSQREEETDKPNPPSTMVAKNKSNKNKSPSAQSVPLSKAAPKPAKLSETRAKTNEEKGAKRPVPKNAQKVDKVNGQPAPDKAKKEISSKPKEVSKVEASTKINGFSEATKEANQGTPDQPLPAPAVTNDTKPSHEDEPHAETTNELVKHGEKETSHAVENVRTSSVPEEPAKEKELSEKIVEKPETTDENLALEVDKIANDLISTLDKSENIAQEMSLQSDQIPKSKDVEEEKPASFDQEKETKGMQSELIIESATSPSHSPSEQENLQPSVIEEAKELSTPIKSPTSPSEEALQALDEHQPLEYEEQDIIEKDAPSTCKISEVNDDLLEDKEEINKEPIIEFSQAESDTDEAKEAEATSLLHESEDYSIKQRDVSSYEITEIEERSSLQGEDSSQDPLVTFSKPDSEYDESEYRVSTSNSFEKELCADAEMKKSNEEELEETEATKKKLSESASETFSEKDTNAEEINETILEKKSINDFDLGPAPPGESEEIHEPKNERAPFFESKEKNSNVDEKEKDTKELLEGSDEEKEVEMLETSSYSNLKDELENQRMSTSPELAEIDKGVMAMESSEISGMESESKIQSEFKEKDIVCDDVSAQEVRKDGSHYDADNRTQNYEDEVSSIINKDLNEEANNDIAELEENKSKEPHFKMGEKDIDVQEEEISNDDEDEEKDFEHLDYRKDELSLKEYVTETFSEHPEFGDELINQTGKELDNIFYEKEGTSFNKEEKEMVDSHDRFEASEPKKTPKNQDDLVFTERISNKDISEFESRPKFSQDKIDSLNTECTNIEDRDHREKQIDETEKETDVQKEESRDINIAASKQEQYYDNLEKEKIIHEEHASFSEDPTKYLADDKDNQLDYDNYSDDGEVIRHATPPGEHNFYENIGPVKEGFSGEVNELQGHLMEQYLCSSLARPMTDVTEQPLYEEQEESEPEVDVKSPLEEHPVYTSTQVADFPEFVTLSGGTTPSDPQSPRSPLDARSKLYGEEPLRRDGFHLNEPTTLLPPLKEDTTGCEVGESPPESPIHHDPIHYAKSEDPSPQLIAIKSYTDKTSDKRDDKIGLSSSSEVHHILLENQTSFGEVGNANEKEKETQESSQPCSSPDIEKILEHEQSPPLDHKDIILEEALDKKEALHFPDEDSEFDKKKDNIDFEMDLSSKSKHELDLDLNLSPSFRDDEFNSLKKQDDVLSTSEENGKELDSSKLEDLAARELSETESCPSSEGWKYESSQEHRRVASTGKYENGNKTYNDATTPSQITPDSPEDVPNPAMTASFYEADTRCRGYQSADIADEYEIDHGTNRDFSPGFNSNGHGYKSTYEDVMSRGNNDALIENKKRESSIESPDDLYPKSPESESSDADSSEDISPRRNSSSPHSYTNKAYIQEDSEENSMDDYPLQEQHMPPSSKWANEPCISHQELQSEEAEQVGARYPAPTARSQFHIEDWDKPMGLPTPPQTPVNGSAPAPSSPAKKLRSSENERSPAKSTKSLSKSKITPIYVDLAYVPHHGDPNYANVEFFDQVRARYYVFSSTNPSKEVLNALLEAKKDWKEDLEVTIIPTYETDTLGYWMALNQETLAALNIDVSPSASRCTVNLQDHETSCAAFRLEF